MRNYCSIEKEKEQGEREGLCERESYQSHVPHSKMAVRQEQGWRDSLSSVLYVLNGRRGGEGSIAPWNVLLALSLFGSALHKHLSFSLLCSSLLLPLSNDRSWQSDNFMNCCIPAWVYAYLNLLDAVFIFYVLTLQDGGVDLGRKEVWGKSLIITSFLCHLLPEVFCLLLPYTWAWMILTKKKSKVDLILRNIWLPPTFL